MPWQRAKTSKTVVSKLISKKNGLQSLFTYYLNNVSNNSNRKEGIRARNKLSSCDKISSTVCWNSTDEVDLELELEQKRCETRERTLSSPRFLKNLKFKLKFKNLWIQKVLSKLHDFILVFVDIGDVLLAVTFTQLINWFLFLITK